MSSSGWNGRKLHAAALLISFLVCTSSTLFSASEAHAQILVIAPHPDDDIITSAGVIYRARQAGTVVWVMYMTNGDYASTGTEWGLQRESEAVAAQALLGVLEDHLVFLGYPDGSLQNLYGSFFNTAYVPERDGYQGDVPILRNQSTVTYASHGLGGTDYHRFVFGSPAPDMGSNVQADLVHFLTNRAPTDIYTVSRCDRHPDHTTTYEFLMSALQVVRASNSGYDPVVHQTVVWAGFNLPLTDPPDPNPADADDWPLAPNPTTFFTEPVRIASCLATNSLVWSQRESLEVPAPLQVANYGTNLKSRAIDLHDTQGGFNAITVRDRNDGHISAFVHRDEFFYPFRASGSRPPLDGGTRPAVDAGVDSGTQPQLDSGTPVDSGTPRDSGAQLDSGTRLDSGTSDSGSRADASTGVDAGASRLDSGALHDASTQVADAAMLADAQGPDAGIAAGASPSLDAALSGAAPGTVNAPPPPELGFSGGISAWPGDEGFEQDVDNILGGYAADGTSKVNESGCSLATHQGSSPLSSGFATFGIAAFLLGRRRMRL